MTIIAQGVVPTTKTQIYTCPSGKLAEVKTIKIHNSGADDAIVSLFSKTTNSIQTELFLMVSGDTIEVSPSYPYSYTVGQGIEASSDKLNVVTYVILGRENAV